MKASLIFRLGKKQTSYDMEISDETSSVLEFELKEIVEPYEKRKAEYIESKLEAVDEILNGREREGTDVTCPNCAYSWTFRGYSNRVTCTNCGHQF